MAKFLQCKTFICLFIGFALIGVQLYIAINAKILIDRYYDYKYYDDTKKCYDIEDLSFSLYHKTQNIYILNLIGASCILLMYSIAATCKPRENVENNLLHLYAIVITCSCLIAMAANAWPIINIHTITDEEAKLWNSIDTYFISQYYVIEVFLVAHIGNMILNSI